jgi:hypothetical protein
MNGIELGMSFIAIVTAAIVFHYRETTSTVAAIWNVLALSAVLIFVAAEATQFLTVDDGVFVRQVLDPNDRGASQWKLGAFRTGLLILLLPARLGPLLGADFVQTAMLMKATWWLVGVALFSSIAVQVAHLTSGRLPMAIAGPFVLGCALLLPTNNLALKTVNYDLLSVTLSVLAALLGARHLKDGRSYTAYASIVLATLAAQEKLSASPVLIALILIFAWKVALDTERTPQAVALRALTAAAKGLAIALLVNLASAAMFAAIGPKGFLAAHWLMAADPVSSWLWVPIRFLSGTTDFLANRGIVFAASLTLTLGVGVSGALLLRAAQFPRWSSRFVNSLLHLTCRAIPIALFLLGVIGVYAVTAYWAPYQPGDPLIVGRFHELNGVILHFNERSIAGHYTSYLLYAASVVIVAIPVTIWAIFVISTLGEVAARRWLALPLIVEASVPLLLFMMLVALATNVPIAHRYLNIWICAAALVFAARFALLLASNKLAGRIAPFLLPVIVLTALVETADFKPLYAAYRPFWVRYSDAERAEPGRLNPSWMGWGEDLMLAGKAIERACLSNQVMPNGGPCTAVTLRPFGYQGTWLPGPSIIKLDQTTQIVGDPAKMTAYDYYLVNRLSLIQSHNIPDVSPEFVVKFRGYILAWVYRGDELLRAGYKFGSYDVPPKFHGSFERE